MFYKIFKVLCRFWFGKILHTDVIGTEKQRDVASYWDSRSITETFNCEKIFLEVN